MRGASQITLPEAGYFEHLWPDRLRMALLVVLPPALIPASIVFLRTLDNGNAFGTELVWFVAQVSVIAWLWLHCLMARIEVVEGSCRVRSWNLRDHAVGLLDAVELHPLVNESKFYRVRVGENRRRVCTMLCLDDAVIQDLMGEDHPRS